MGIQLKRLFELWHFELMECPLRAVDYELEATAASVEI